MHRIHLYNNLERRRDISVPIYQCLSTRWKRRDTIKLLSRETGRPICKVKEIIEKHQTYLLYDGVEKIIDRLRQNILNQDLKDLSKIVYREKADPSSLKIRTIGVESIEQQLYDEIADYALQPLKRKIGTYQIACLKGKGSSAGNRAIRRWMRDRRVRWAVQTDVKKCYESIDKQQLMKFLRHAIKGSPRVLWLIEALINTHRKGLNIGCKLSQDLVNIYLSLLYHFMTEQVFTSRYGNESYHLAVCHALFQMDDFLLLCRSKQDAFTAVNALLKKASELGIKIKANWKIFKLDNFGNSNKGTTFVDIIGIRFYRKSRALRRRVYIRIRRSLSKAQKIIRMHKRIPVRLAKRIVSHVGCLVWTDHFLLWRKYKISKTLQICKEVISNESKILRQARTC